MVHVSIKNYYVYNVFHLLSSKLLINLWRYKNTTCCITGEKRLWKCTDNLTYTLLYVATYTMFAWVNVIHGWHIIVHFLACLHERNLKREPLGGSLYKSRFFLSYPIFKLICSYTYRTFHTFSNETKLILLTATVQKPLKSLWLLKLW